MTKPVDLLLARVTRLPHLGGRGWKAVCPLAAGDRDHVLKIDVRADDSVLVFCHNGCRAESVLAAVNLRLSDLYPLRTPRRSRQGPAQSPEVRLAAMGLTETQIQEAIARSRSRRADKG